MRSKEKSVDEMIGHRKRLEKRKEVESDIKDVTKEKTVNDNPATKNKAIKKKAIDKKAMMERQKIISERIMDNIRKGNIENPLKEEYEEPKVIITKEERAKRLERLREIAQDVMKKWNE